MKKTSGDSPRDPRELSRYRSKRDPAQTTEPFSAERKGSTRATRAGRFVVHLHQARREHYDLRIECGGTLQSFAVPRGPSLKPLDKRLAVHTENHPLEYLDFEAVIPEGNYGAGSMIVWDTGRIRYLETSAEEGLARGDLKFELSGFKLRGTYALVQTGRRKTKLEVGQGEQSDWLLIKKADAYANAELDIVEGEPRGVLSGLTAEENFRKAEVVAELEQLVAAYPAKSLSAQGLTPMLCALEGATLKDPERLYELKLDGVRIVAEKRGPQVALRYRNGRSATASYAEVARAVSLLPIQDALLDGEIVTFDAQGKPSFEKLAPRIHAQRPLDIEHARSNVPVVYLVFDLLSLAGRDLTSLPLLERKRILAQLVRGRGLLRMLDHIEDDGSALYDFCRRERLEGVVAKKKQSPYRVGPRRSSEWVKLKCERDDDFVVMGYVTGTGSRKSLGALCLGVYVRGELEYRGRVGSGLSDAMIRVLLERLPQLSQSAYPGRGDVPEDPGTERASWVRPELVVQVRYLGFTEEGRLRAPVFLGLRPDVEPESCAASPPALSAPEPTGGTALGTGRVLVSNPDKVFWPESGYTKLDLCSYYASIAPHMLPFLRGRPLVLVRHPDGIAGKSFYQWNVPEGTPSWMRRLDISDTDDVDRTPKNVFLVDDDDSLVYLANLGCIPLHVLACRETALGTCDFLTVDFDLGERPFADAVRLGLTLREVLDDVGLPGFPKTSGQRGLHVLVPLGAGIPFEAAKLLVELLGRIVTARHPQIATMERKLEKRGDRVYVDTGQTGTSRTIVAPYSVRAHAGATVSTPLAWEELHAGLDPSRFTIVTVPLRAAEIDDPLRGFDEAKPDVASALAALERWVGR